MNVRVRKTNKNFDGFKVLEKGDWIDLAICGEKNIGTDVDNDTTICYNMGETLFFDFGFAMELPEGYEAVILPRSGTFKKYGLIQTNSMGVVDNSYCGDNDTWKGMFYATRNGEFNIGDRIAQFRIQEKMVKPTFEYVKHLGNEDRGGYGSTGK